MDIQTNAGADFYTLSNKSKYTSSFLIMFEDGSMLRSLRLHKSINPDSEKCKNISKLGGKLCGEQGDLIVDVNG